MALRTHRSFDLFYFIMCEDPTQIEVHWNSIWLRARSHMASHYTWRPVTALHGFGGVLGRPLDTLFWALKTPWSRLLAHVCSGPKLRGWGEPTCTLVPWRQGFRHPTWDSIGNFGNPMGTFKITHKCSHTTGWTINPLILQTLIIHLLIFHPPEVFLRAVREVS